MILSLVSISNSFVYFGVIEAPGYHLIFSPNTINVIFSQIPNKFWVRSSTYIHVAISQIQNIQIDIFAWMPVSYSNLLVIIQPHHGPLTPGQKLDVSVSLMPFNIVASQVPRAGTHNVLLNPSLISTCVCACMLGCVQLFATPWTVACQAPRSMEFSRHEHWSGLPFYSTVPPGKPLLCLDLSN